MADYTPTTSTMSRVPLLLHSLLERGAWLQPNNKIIEKTATGYHVQTYAEHKRQTRMLASALAAAGVMRGDRVATFMWNTNRHLVAYHAVPCMGSVLHPLNIRLSPAELAFVFGDAEHRLCIVDQDLLARFAQLPEGAVATLDLGVVVCGPIEGDDAPHWRHSRAALTLAKKLPIPEQQLHDYDEFILTGQEGEYRWPEDMDEHAACCMCYTSGTSGNPKGVVYSHRSTYINTLEMQAKDNLDLGSADVILPVVPYFHANGWGLPQLTLMLGNRVVHIGRYTDAASILQSCLDWGVTYSAAVPTIWQRVRKEVELYPDKYQSEQLMLNHINCGGSAPPNDLMRWYKDELGVRFSQGWGMTETLSSGTTAKMVTTWEHAQQGEEEQFQNVTVAGIPLCGVEVKLVEAADFSKELPQDGKAQGELLVRGPTVTARYYKSDNVTTRSRFVPGGWLATGDICSIKDGAVIIHDRSKDLIKSGGEWISSKDMENIITSMSEVAQCAVVGQPHPKWDERPVVVLVPVENHPNLEGISGEDGSGWLQAVRKHCESKLAKFQLPDDVIVWKELPLNSTGKVSKKEIRARLEVEQYMLPDLRPQSKL